MWHVRGLHRPCVVGTPRAAAALQAAAAADGGRAVAAVPALAHSMPRRMVIGVGAPLWRCGACRHAHSTTGAASGSAPSGPPPTANRSSAADPAISLRPAPGYSRPRPNRDASASRSSVPFGSDSVVVSVRACSAWVVRAQSAARQGQTHLLELASWPRLDRFPERVNLHDAHLLAAAERTWRNMHDANAERWGLRVTDASGARFLPSPFHYAFLLRAYSRAALGQDAVALGHVVRLMDELLMQTSINGTTDTNATDGDGDDVDSLQLFPASLYGSVMRQAVRVCSPVLMSQDHDDSSELRLVCYDIVQRLVSMGARARSQHTSRRLTPLCCVGADGLATNVPLPLRAAIPSIHSDATSWSTNLRSLQTLLRNLGDASSSRLSSSADPHEAGAALLRLLEASVRSAHWDRFETLWGQLDPLLRSSVDHALQNDREPTSPPAARPSHLLRLDEIHRAFHLLALVSLRSSGDPRAIHRGLLDIWSWADIAALRLVQVRDVQLALVWGFYLRREWDVVMELRAQAISLDCYALSDVDDVADDDETLFQEFMLECLTRCAQQEQQHTPHVHVSNPARSEAHQRLLTFAWAGAPTAATATPPASSSSSSSSFRLPSTSLLSQSSRDDADATKKELLALYANLEQPGASDPASPYRGSTAALRTELRDITRRRRLSICWAESRPDDPCPIDTAIDAQDAADAAAEEAKLHGLPQPPPPPRLPPRKKHLLHVVFHHYSTPSSVHASMALLLRCLAALEPQHGVPEVHVRMAPWQPQDMQAHDLHAPDEHDDHDHDHAHADLYAGIFSQEDASPSASASAREHEEAMLAWSGGESDNHVAAMHVLTRTWATLLQVDEAAMWADEERTYVRLPAAPLARLTAALTSRVASGGTLRDALQRLGMRPKLKMLTWREESPGASGAASSPAAAASAPGALRLPSIGASPSAAVDHHYSTMRGLLRPGEQRIQSSQQSTAVGTMQ